MTIVYNPKNHNYSTMSRCHPVFELAVEGAITECYQRGVTVNNVSDIYGVMCPLFKQIFANKPMEFSNIMAEAGRDFNFPSEKIFTTAINKSNYNSDCFLSDGDYSNDEFLEYYINLFNKHNQKIYIYDTSIINEIRSIIAYSPDFIPVGKKIDTITDKDEYKIYDNFWNNVKSTDIKSMIKSILSSELSDWEVDVVSLFYCQFNLITVFEPSFTYHLKEDKNKFNNTLFEVIKDNFGNSVSDVDKVFIFYHWLISSEYYDVIIKYAMLFKYRWDKYTKEEVHEIFSFNGGEDFTDEDWDNCLDMSYICKNIIYPKFLEIYTDEFLEGLLRPYLVNEFKNVENNR